MGRLQEVARTRLRGGEGSRLDVVTLDAQRAGLESEIDDALLALKEQKLTLNRLMGRPSAGIDWRVSGWDPPRGVSVRESDWIATALERRSELQERVWELKALGAEVRLARFSPFAGASAGVASERDQGWSVGPEVTGPLPLFDWGQARREAVAAQRLEARHRLTQVQREVVEQVRRAALEFDQSVRQLQRVRRELIPLQEQRRELAEAAFRAGQTDVTTLVLAEQDLAAARARAVELERRNSTAMVRLERAVGGPGVAASLVRSATATTSPSDPVPPATAPATPPTR
jgi:outer membrane protein TolC